MTSAVSSAKISHETEDDWLGIEMLLQEWEDDDDLEAILTTRVWLDTNGGVADPTEGSSRPFSQAEYFKGEDFMVAVRKEFVSVWVRKASRRFDVVGDLQHTMAAACKMMGDFDDDAFRPFVRECERIYFSQSIVTIVHDDEADPSGA